MNSEEARKIVAQIWCQPDFESVEMDVWLAEAFSEVLQREVNKALSTKFTTMSHGQMGQILGQVIDRRISQDQQWGGPDGDDNNTPYHWCTFISKQSVEALAHTTLGTCPATYRDRMLDIAALAVAAIASCDRCEGGEDD